MDRSQSGFTIRRDSYSFRSTGPPQSALSAVGGAAKLAALDLRRRLPSSRPPLHRRPPSWLDPATWNAPLVLVVLVVVLLVVVLLLVVLVVLLLLLL